jgi:hypothetical protein
VQPSPYHKCHHLLFCWWNIVCRFPCLSYCLWPTLLVNRNLLNPYAIYHFHTPSSWNAHTIFWFIGLSYSECYPSPDSDLQCLVFLP